MSFDQSRFEERISANIPTSNRSFKYGDGLFETIIIHKDKFLFWNDHVERIKLGFEICHYDVDADFFVNLKDDIFKLINVNSLADSYFRVRVQFCRVSGGLYTPNSNKVEYWLEASAFEPAFVPFIKIDFANGKYISQNQFSSLKTASALGYVLASIEKKQRNLDELILLTNDGMVSECCASNIFWEAGGVWFTPALRTGCIAGVMRKNILRTFQDQKVELMEIESPSISLLKANCIFLTNVTGIKFVHLVGDQIINSVNSALTLKKVFERISPVIIFDSSQF